MKYKRKDTTEETRQLLELRRSGAASPHRNRKRYRRADDKRKLVKESQI